VVSVALHIIVALWLAIGIWLSVDSVKKALPRIQAEYGYVLWPLLAIIFCVGVFWLPAPFFRALWRGKP
jgi:hypothetical protein